MTKDFRKAILRAAAILLLFSSPAFCAGIITKQNLVVIDPGHTNGSPGLISPSGQKEHDLALELARRILQHLSKNCRAILTESSINPIPESERTAFANKEKADLFISIHLHNTRSEQPLIFYADLPAQSGAQTTWQTRAALHKTASKELAEAVARTYKSDTPNLRPIILGGPIAPLEGLGMPGILVESFSITQIPGDPDKGQAFLEHHATILADAVLAFLTTYKP